MDLSPASASVRDRLLARFPELFDQAPEVVSFAPGRVELLGNHTDYNEGLTLSYAVREGTTFVGARTDGDSRILWRANPLEDAPLASDGPLGDVPGWVRYGTGVLRELEELGIDVPPFVGLFGGDLPLSSGMSSSASLAMCLALGMLELVGEELPPLEIARLGQRVEHAYLDAPTGLLDQLSSLLGKQGQAVRLDFRTLDHAHVPLPPDLALVAFNTHVAHDLSDEYAHRRSSCERAVAVLRRAGHPVSALRDVTPALLDGARPRLSPLQYRRAHHVVHENRRVEQAVAAMEGGDTGMLGQLMHESHDSSRERFENSCRELDTLVDLARDLPGHVGARLSGGGFGGITIHAVDRIHVEDYSERLCEDYEQVVGRRPTPLRTDPGGGARTETLKS